jgi:hypothetical protein
MAAEIPPGSVIVTPQDMWQAIGEIRDSSHRTEGTINELKNMVNPALGDLKADYAKLEVRVVDLERSSWSSKWVPAIVMAVLCSTIAGILVYIVTHITP